MPKYRAQLWFNIRAHYHFRIEAPDDEAAIAKVKTITPDEWLLGTFGSSSDDPDITSDGLIDLDRLTASGFIDDAVLESHPVKEALPYSWDAAEFVKRVANLKCEMGEHAQLSALIEDAKKLLTID